MELNNHIFQTLSEIAGSAEPTLTTDHVRAMGLDPQADRSFLVNLLDVYGFNITMVIDNLCCTWAPSVPLSLSGKVHMPLRPWHTKTLKTLPPLSDLACYLLSPSGCAFLLCWSIWPVEVFFHPLWIRRKLNTVVSWRINSCWADMTLGSDQPCDCTHPTSLCTRSVR